MHGRIALLRSLSEYPLISVTLPDIEEDRPDHRVPISKEFSREHNQ